MTRIVFSEQGHRRVFFTSKRDELANILNGHQFDNEVEVDIRGCMPGYGIAEMVDCIAEKIKDKGGAKSIKLIHADTVSIDTFFPHHGVLVGSMSPSERKKQDLLEKYSIKLIMSGESSHVK